MVMTWKPKLNHANGSCRTSQNRKKRAKLDFVYSFLRLQGVVHYEFLPQGRMVNKEYYLQVMCNLCKAICPNLWKIKNWLLHHENALANIIACARIFDQNQHTNNAKATALPRFGLLWVLWLFFVPKIEEARERTTIKEIKKKSKEELNKITKNEFLKYLEDWKKRWHKCIISGRDYFEGNKIDIHE
jgi:Transposase (partial DDE domain)